MPGGCPNGPMCTGSGGRGVDYRVSYGRCFNNVPHVVIGTKWIDCGASYTVLVIEAKNIDECGFTASFGTWGNYRISAAVANWIAF